MDWKNEVEWVIHIAGSKTSRGNILVFAETIYDVWLARNMQNFQHKPLDNHISDTVINTVKSRAHSKLALHRIFFF